MKLSPDERRAIYADAAGPDRKLIAHRDGTLQVLFRLRDAHRAGKTAQDHSVRCGVDGKPRITGRLGQSKCPPVSFDGALGLAGVRICVSVGRLRECVGDSQGIHFRNGP